MTIEPSRKNLPTRIGIVPSLGILLLMTSNLVQAKDQKAATQSVQHVTAVRTTVIKAEPIGSGAYVAPEVDTREGLGGDARVAGSGASRRSNLPIPSKERARLGLSAASIGATALPLPEPTVQSSSVVGWQARDFTGFDGLNNIDQRTANGGRQFSLEPPDQGLCAGNGYVVEAVNNVIQVYDRSGNPLTGAEALNSFFGLAPAIIREPNPANDVVGPFLSDPRCFYDGQTKRWFVSELEQDNGNNKGSTGRYYNLLAVSQTSNPTGQFTVFSYDVTDDGLDGTPYHGGCPCFGDQPLIGADEFGVYQSTNEYGAATFNGAQIYAVSKSKLVAVAAGGTGGLPLIHIDASQELVPFGGLSYTIQPSRTASSYAYEAALNGVEYALSALQFGNPGYETYDNRIAVWAITNTKSLNSASPVLTLSFNVIHSEIYGQPDPATQKAGDDIPLGASLGDPEELLDTNDDRMNQVTYSNGLLYGSVNSKLKVGGASQTGSAWFAVQPSFKGPTLEGTVTHQGYVAVAGNNVIFPSVGVDADNDGAIVFTLTGHDYFPSVAYTTISNGATQPLVHAAGAGQGPEDGFSGYPQFGGGGVARWGDYSAATWDGERVWFAGEYIPRDCEVNALPCRESLMNWGTFVGSILLK